MNADVLEANCVDQLWAVQFGERSTRLAMLLALADVVITRDPGWHGTVRMEVVPRSPAVSSAARET